MNTKEKQAQGASNREWGALAEDIIRKYYIVRGYTVRETNFRSKYGEIDLIVQRDNIIAFVEVKARSGDNQDPVMAVDTRKQRKMARIADRYLQDAELTYQYRFDIATLTGSPDDYEIECYMDAFLVPLNLPGLSTPGSSMR